MAQRRADALVDLATDLATAHPTPPARQRSRPGRHRRPAVARPPPHRPGHRRPVHPARPGHPTRRAGRARPHPRRPGPTHRRRPHRHLATTDHRRPRPPPRPRPNQLPTPGQPARAHHRQRPHLPLPRLLPTSQTLRHRPHQALRPGRLHRRNATCSASAHDTTTPNTTPTGRSPAHPTAPPTGPAPPAATTANPPTPTPPPPTHPKNQTHHRPSSWRSVSSGWVVSPGGRSVRRVVNTGRHAPMQSNGRPGCAPQDEGGPVRSPQDKGGCVRQDEVAVAIARSNSQIARSDSSWPSSSTR